MRLFVALEVPDEVREKLAAIRDRFPKPQSQMRWVRAEQFHVTLKFIGEVDEEKVDEIMGALRAVQQGSPVQCGFCGLGWYWNAKGFGMLFSKIEDDGSLRALASRVDECLQPANFEPEHQEYMPHLTLARCKPLKSRPRSAVPEDLSAVARETEGLEFGRMQAREMHLMQSKLGTSGPKYSRVATFPLVAEHPACS